MGKKKQSKSKSTQQNNSSYQQKGANKVEVRVEKEVIGEYDHAPDFMKDNKHITHGYRINFNSPWKILKSLFMVHNESVNIWTHFLPAIIICAIIFGLAVFVDKENLVHEFKHYYQNLGDSFEHYSHTLDNLTLIERMDRVKNITENELSEIQQNIVHSFHQFRDGLNYNIENLNHLLEINVTGIQDSMRANIKKNIENLEVMKDDFEKIIAPGLISKMSTYDNFYISVLKERMNLLREQLDSETFKYIDLLHQESPNPHKVSRWPIIVFLCSAFICLMCSTLFHLFYPMSSASYVVFNRFDYAGISILIAGSTFPPLYYGMYCYLQVFIFYQIIESVLAVTIFISSMFKWMHKPENSLYKALIYGGFGVFNVIPMSHLIINSVFYGNGDGFSFATSAPYIGLLGVSYLFGLYVYTVRCPERHYPGKFNLCGHSHQIWHICVVAGIIFTYLGALESFDMRKSHVCPV